MRTDVRLSDDETDSEAEKNDDDGGGAVTARQVGSVCFTVPPRLSVK